MIDATAEARFWAKVDMSGECWEWTATSDQTGYGIFVVGSTKHYRAHRFSWQRTHGEIPAGLLVCHRCDNPRCVRPSHLFLGTYRDNTRDMIAKGRAVLDKAPRGTEQPQHKLVDGDIVAIRNRAAAGELHRHIAVDFGVSRPLISEIVRRQAWRHVA